MSVSDSLTIDVPQGQGSIQYFVLEPNLPQDGKPGTWHFKTIDGDGNTQEIENLSIVFNKNSNWLQRQSETCVLVVTMNKPGWRFAMGGTKNCKTEDSTADVLHDVSSEISGNGKVLTTFIKSLGNLDEKVGFSFVAAHVTEDGTTTVYQSPDPGTDIRR